MSVNSEELNYLIWRYCQEMGHEVSALALQDETRVLEFDEKFKEHIPVGTLVNLVQKGILYAESELLVKNEGNKMEPEDEKYYQNSFNLVQALEVDREKYPELASSGKFALEHNEDGENIEDEIEIHTEEQTEFASNVVEKQESEKSSEIFSKTLSEIEKVDKMSVCQWHPIENDLVACGLSSLSSVKLFKVDLENFKLQEVHELKHSEGLILSLGHEENEVTALAWSPNGKQLVTGIKSGELKLWTKEGVLLNALNYHRSPIVVIKWNTNSSLFLSSDAENATILWNATSGTALQHFEYEERKTSEDTLGVDLEWLDSTKFAIPGLQGAILIYSVESSKPIGKLIGHRRSIGIINFNRETKLLLSASDDHTIKIWAGGSSNPCNSFHGHSQSIVHAAWIDSDRLISASLDGSIRVWSRKANTMVAISTVDGVPIFASSLSNDKTKYAVGFMDGQMTIFDLSSLLATVPTATTSASVVPTSLPVYGNHQTEFDGNSIYDLSWNQTSSCMAIAYSMSKGSIVRV